MLSEFLDALLRFHLHFINATLNCNKFNRPKRPFRILSYPRKDENPKIAFTISGRYMPQDKNSQVFI